MVIVPGTVTIATDGPIIAAQQLVLSAPDRLVVDLSAVLPEVLTAPGAASVSGVRGAMFAPGIARLVFDLQGPLEISEARTEDKRLVISLRRVLPAAFAEMAKRGRRPLPILNASKPPLPASPPPTLLTPADSFELPTTMFGGAATVTDPAPELAPVTLPSRTDVSSNRARSGSKPLVVIDAGHGGKDVGATSVNGAYEKAITLAIALETARLLEKSGKVRVKLTRDDDRFIPLGGRVAIARAARADLFISIHADAAPNGEARGASVYTLSAVASDAVAARLAARENKADIIGGVNLGVEAPEVGDIMIDLSRRATGNVSVAFAEVLQDELSNRMTFRGEFHHFAGFYVLKAPDVPSVLLETGYVTNAEDSEFLFSSAGRRKIARGIARAIERHLRGDA